MALRKTVLLLLILATPLVWGHADEATEAAVLTTKTLKDYIERFNADDEELYPQAINNAGALAFLEDNIPLFSCPDKIIERTYYYRWWTYRKHIKQIPEGHIITEFLPNVPWAAKYNAITCPGTHHFREGRWIHDPRVPSRLRHILGKTFRGPP